MKPSSDFVPPSDVAGGVQQQSMGKRTPAMFLEIVEDYSPCSALELPVTRGEILKLVYFEAHWMFVQARNGSSGYVPRRHCKIFQEGPAQTNPMYASRYSAAPPQPRHVTPTIIVPAPPPPQPAPAPYAEPSPDSTVVAGNTVIKVEPTNGLFGNKKEFAKRRWGRVTKVSKEELKNITDAEVPDYTKSTGLFSGRNDLAKQRWGRVSKVSKEELETIGQHVNTPPVQQEKETSPRGKGETKRRWGRLSSANREELQKIDETPVNTVCGRKCKDSCAHQVVVGGIPSGTESQNSSEANSVMIGDGKALSITTTREISHLMANQQQETGDRSPLPSPHTIRHISNLTVPQAIDNLIVPGSVEGSSANSPGSGRRRGSSSSLPCVLDLPGGRLRRGRRPSEPISESTVRSVRYSASYTAPVVKASSSRRSSSVSASQSSLTDVAESLVAKAADRKVSRARRPSRAPEKMRSGRSKSAGNILDLLRVHPRQKTIDIDNDDSAEPTSPVSPVSPPAATASLHNTPQQPRRNRTISLSSDTALIARDRSRSTNSDQNSTKITTPSPRRKSISTEDLRLKRLRNDSFTSAQTRVCEQPQAIDNPVAIVQLVYDPNETNGYVSKVEIDSKSPVALLSVDHNRLQPEQIRTRRTSQNRRVSQASQGSRRVSRHSATPDLLVVKDYIKKANTDITISMGEFLRALDSSSSNWTYVENQMGEQGYVPNACIAANHDVSPISSPPVQPPQSVSPLPVEVEVSNLRLDSRTETTLASDVTSLTQMRILEAYTGTQADDLSVEVGDVVFCNTKDQIITNWLWVYSTRTKRAGYVPDRIAQSQSEC